MPCRAGVVDLVGDGLLADAFGDGSSNGRMTSCESSSPGSAAAADEDANS